MDSVASSHAVLEMARAGLRDLGYREDLVRRHYRFADVLHEAAPERQIDLAAFGQEPLSYRTACLGVLVAEEVDTARVKQMRALGAPQVLVLRPGAARVARWKVGGQGDPVEIEELRIPDLPEAMHAHRQDWSPEAVLRAKAIGFGAAPIQLDFFDAALVPVLDNAVFTRLDALVRRATAAGEAAYQEHHLAPLDPAGLFRLVFRLITAKLLADHGYPGGWATADAAAALHSVERYYVEEATTEPAAVRPPVPQVVWDHIRAAFSFQNLSVEALAFIYENTLVTREVRRDYGVHATPPEIAAYVVRALPLWTLPLEERRVFEPFAGAAPFLIAALGQLRSLLPDAAQLSAQGRHAYFVRMLSGMEIDSFAREVAHDALIVADLPNNDGWRVVGGNFFTSTETDTLLQQAQVVLCNPPYEDFSAAERAAHPEIQLPNKAAEALRRVLQHPPQMLGFVLPRVFIYGQLYRAARRELAVHYSNIDVVALPDTVFQHSEAETVLLIAHGEPAASPRRRAIFVNEGDYPRFVRTGEPTWAAQLPDDLLGDSANPVLWATPLARIWAALADLPRLAAVATVHRGIEYNKSLKEHAEELISALPRPGFTPGLATVAESLDPYEIRTIQYLNVDPALMLYQAYKRPWHQPKVIASAGRARRDRWVLAAAVDRQGLVCSQNFHGLWPRGNLPLEVIAAVLNGPIANAYVSEQRTSRHNQVGTVRAIPIPRLTPAQVEAIVALVQDYEATRARWQAEPFAAVDLEQRCRRLLEEIDAAVLTAYDLPPRLERQLLDYFAGYRRPGPVAFTAYYPPGFRPAIPFRMYIAPEFPAAAARATLARLPRLNDPVISALVEDLD